MAGDEETHLGMLVHRSRKVAGQVKRVVKKA